MPHGAVTWAEGWPGIEGPITSLTFDCYGTLVDWQRGACDALRALHACGLRQMPDRAIVEAFLAADTRLIGERVTPYRVVLERAAIEASRNCGGALDEAGARRFAASVPDWPLFDDTNAALERLRGRYRLSIISNIDDALIRGTLRSFAVRFEMVMTSEQAGCYKPEAGIFAQALARLGEPPGHVLHVAEGLCEARPARALGMGSVWVRRTELSDDGSGAVPHGRVDSLAELAGRLCPEA